MTDLPPPDYAVRREKIARDVATVREALADLHEYIKAEYPSYRLDYPVQRRKFERDMGEMTEADAALDRLSLALTPERVIEPEGVERAARAFYESRYGLPEGHLLATDFDKRGQSFIDADLIAMRAALEAYHATPAEADHTRLSYTEEGAGAAECAPSLPTEPDVEFDDGDGSYSMRWFKTDPQRCYSLTAKGRQVTMAITSLTNLPHDTGWTGTLDDMFKALMLHDEPDYYPDRFEDQNIETEKAARAVTSVEGLRHLRHMPLIFEAREAAAGCECDVCVLLSRLADALEGKRT